MMLSGRFTGKIAVVTGGARGIGKAYCERLVEEGASVVIADIDFKRAQATASQLTTGENPIIAIQVDVASEDSVREMYAEIVERLKRVDFLINNAAIMLDVERPFKPFWELEWNEWTRVMNVNAGGVYLCSKYVKPIMEKLGEGRIINISSDAIWKGYEGQLAYFASKGAVAVMTRCLARELGPFNIAVNAIAPGYTLSESVQGSEFMRSVEPKVMESRAIQRKQYPQDLAGTVMFLCSNESQCITGQTIVVDYGSVMP